MTDAVSFAHLHELILARRNASVIAEGHFNLRLRLHCLNACLIRDNGPVGDDIDLIHPASLLSCQKPEHFYKNTGICERFPAQDLEFMYPQHTQDLPEIGNNNVRRKMFRLVVILHQVRAVAAFAGAEFGDHESQMKELVFRSQSLLASGSE